MKPCDTSVLALQDLWQMLQDNKTVLLLLL